MAFTPSPTPPNSGDPAAFNTRADAFLGWMAIFAAELNAQLPLISAQSWASYGGSANVITLTAGFVSLATGMQVRFRATAANTGAATINLDGLGAKACRTVTGAALPAGYIRTNADTLATYDGTNWVLSRETERGGNANGQYVRMADGSQFCAREATVDLTTAIGGDFTMAAANVVIEGAGFFVVRGDLNMPGGDLQAMRNGFVTASSTQWRFRTDGSGTSAAFAGLGLYASGRWY
jgi:hypothetical protein